MSRSQRVLGVSLGASNRVASSVNENSKYQVGDDLYILLDEVLNNSIRAILIYDDFSGRFTDMDAIALASVLRYNTSVISLNLCGVDIGDHAVSLLCDALARSHVRVIDLSDTYLADESGVALAALAQCNPNIRTVVLDDTLIPEELMDDIDVACQNNETMYELGPPEAINPDRPRYCVYHCFGVCPNGDFCELLHRSITLVGKDATSSGPAAGKGRVLELPPLPKEGASWKAPKQCREDGAKDDDDDSDNDSPRFRLVFDEMEPTAAAAAVAGGGGGGGGGGGNSSMASVFGAPAVTICLCVGILTVAVAWRLAR